MKQPSQQFLLADHNDQQIQLVCRYKNCTLERFIYTQVAIDAHQHELLDQSHIIQKNEYDNQLVQQIKDAQYQIIKFPPSDKKQISVGAISNNLKYIITGGFSRIVTIWNYKNQNIIKKFKDMGPIRCCRFTEDSKLLYAGCFRKLYQFQINDKFNKYRKIFIHHDYISDIYCISNRIILTSSSKAIIKSQFNEGKQMFRIKAYYDFDQRDNWNLNETFMDYNKNLNIIAIGSSSKTIKLWNGNDGQLMIEKQNAHKKYLGDCKVLFINNYNQLISSDLISQFIIWNMNFQEKQLEQEILIEENITNLSLVLNQQYILTQYQFNKVYSINGELIRIIDHQFNPSARQNGLQDRQNIFQLESMKAVLVVEKKCKNLCVSISQTFCLLNTT